MGLFRSGKAAVILAIASVIAAAMWINPKRGIAQDEPRGRNDLEARVEALERLVSHNPMRPKDTIAARMDATELALAKLSAPVHGDTGEPAEIERLRRSLDDVKEDIRDFEQRLRTLEQDKNSASDAVSRNDLREVQREVDSVSREVRELSGDVRRLESSR